MDPTGINDTQGNPWTIDSLIRYVALLRLKDTRVPSGYLRSRWGVRFFFFLRSIGQEGLFVGFVHVVLMFIWLSIGLGGRQEVTDQVGELTTIKQAKKVFA